MNHLPIFLDIRDQRCLVLGGGAVAARKVERCLHYGGRVVVVAPELCASLAALRDAGRITHEARSFRDSDIDGSAVVFAATDDRETNRRASELARAARIPINVVDDPALCSFIMPSVIDRDPVQVAVSTGGASPVLARLLRARLETLIPAAYGELAALMGAFRERVKARIPDGVARRRFWERVLQGPVAELLFAGRRRDALVGLERELQRPQGAERQGEVYLVGAGPGDPDLLTFRALRLMQQADVVVYDRLVAPELLALVRREAERIYVGKERDQHTVPQAEINELLVRLASEGKRVLRLKGGDPFIFGRGGEEIESLSAKGIPFQIVPGITAASGCAAYAGIPLTHRDHAQSVAFVTGHSKDGSVSLDWQAVTAPRQTLVVYMGVKGMDVLTAQLIAHGLDAATPAAVVEQGTTRRQRVITAELATIADRVRAADVHPPSLLIVGTVVRLHETLAWFDPAAELQSAPPDQEVRSANSASTG